MDQYEYALAIENFDKVLVQTKRIWYKYYNLMSKKKRGRIFYGRKVR